MKKPKKQEDTNEFLRKVSSDPRINKLLDMTSKGIYVIDTVKLRKEIKNYHAGRIFRNFKGSEIVRDHVNKISEWVAENNSIRTRVTEIRMQCFDLQRKLDERIKTARNYLAGEYPMELRESGYTTDASKKQAIDHVLKPMIELSYRLETTIQLADTLLKDFVETNWDIHYITVAMGIQFQHERNS